MTQIAIANTWDNHIPVVLNNFNQGKQILWNFLCRLKLKKKSDMMPDRVSAYLYRNGAGKFENKSMVEQSL